MTPVAQFEYVAVSPASGAYAERVVAAAIALLLLPLLASVALTVFLLSGRAPFIAHRRVGLYGRELWVWKFRTMWRSRGPYTMRLVERISDDDGPAQKRPADDRVAGPFARFCRRHSIDELPQLCNIVAGDMSFVGPRPVTRREMRQIFGDAAAEIQQAKPGLTGLWQVSGRNRLTVDERRALDLQLVRSSSQKLRVALLLRTIPELIGGRNTW